MKISDSTAISMPMRNLISIIGAVAVGVWAYFGIVERLNKLETQSVLLEKDMTAEDERLHAEVTKNTEFRIKYPPHILNLPTFVRGRVLTFRPL